MTMAHASAPERQLARAVTATRAAAAALEPELRFVPRAAQALGGQAARVRAEGLLARLYSTLAADALADTYWREEQDDARAAGFDDELGEALIARIEATLDSGNADLGEKLSAELLQLAKSTHDDALLASAEEFIGVLDRRQARTDSASAHQIRALALRRRLGDAAGEAAALTNLGTVARDRGDFAQSLDYQLQALEIRERIDVRLDVAYRNLALLYRELDDEKTTQTYFDKAIAAAQRYAEPSYYASVFGCYASFLNDMRRFDLALAAAGEALAISQALDNRPGVGFERLESGRALLGLGRVDEATTELDLALAAGRATDQRELIARSELSLAEAALARRDLARAHAYLDAAFAHVDGSPMRPQLLQAYDLRDRLAEAEHDPQTAHDYAHRYAHLHDELLGLRSSRLLAAIEVRKARDAAQQQIELAARTNELQAERLQRSRLERGYSLAVIAGLAAVSALFMFLFFSLRKIYRALAVRNHEIDAQREALSTANDQLAQQAQQLYQTSVTDPLTRVYNRAHLIERLSAMLAACNTEGREMTLLMIDFDHFKQINDRHGHLTGDRILVEALRVIGAQLGPDCVLGRFGGEEFIAAFDNRNLDASRQIAERMREAVAVRLSELMPGLKPRPTISIGIALLSQLPPINKVDALIDAADRAVYAAKLGGRNQVRGAHLA